MKTLSYSKTKKDKRLSGIDKAFIQLGVKLKIDKSKN